MWLFLLSFAGMAGFLAGIGITRNRALGLRAWTAVWTCASLAFVVALAWAFYDGGTIAVEAALGGAAGYVVAVGIHTAHHYVELRAGESDTPRPSRTDPRPGARRIQVRFAVVAALLAFQGWLLYRMIVADEALLSALLAMAVTIFAGRLASLARRYAAQRDERERPAPA